MSTRTPPASTSRLSQTSFTSVSAQPPELLVIVRPPPSKNNHPLNVQIQVLTPTSRPVVSDSASGGSFDAVAQASVGLKRTASIQSGRSARSGSSSTTASAVNGSSGGRRVAPLYNLAFHNLQTTVVTDAGTDAKVAKFLKAGGVELLGLAILDPSELSPASSPSLTKSRSPELRPPTPPPSSDTGGNLLTRLRRFSFKPTASPATLPLPHPVAPPTTVANGQPILPLLPTVSLTSDRPRATSRNSSSKGYTWTVRKWLRRDLDPRSASTVHFEWRRGPPPTKQRRPAERVRPAEGLQVPPTGLGQVGRTPSIEGEEMTMDPNNLGRSRSATLTTTVAAGGVRTPETDRSRSPALQWDSDTSPSLEEEEEDDDDGTTDDEDPEDSERPWLCDVVTPSRRVHLGTLTPAPHHPRLVASLAVPFHLGPLALRDGVLSVEELKDVVSVTCLWLIVHEELGGLGKKRKGDANWKLRA